jgi:natural product precursor
MKIQLNPGLKLNKTVISKLQENQMSHVKGGAAAGNSCAFLSCNKKTVK